jgi:multiple sugar transport system permease protein
MTTMREALRRQTRSAYVFIFPALAALTVFFFLPVIAALLLSLTDFDIYSLSNFSNARFVGLKNYFDLMSDPLFWKALTNTVYFVAVGGPLSVVTSLLAALLVNSRMLRFKGIFRSIYFLPVVTTLVAVSIVWRFLYHPRYGMLNYLLSLLGVGQIDWLGDPVWAMPAIILLAVWKNFGYNMIIFIAGLQTIPEYLYEAARLDGASPMQQFKAITVPMLAPTTFFVVIITMIGYFQLFAEPYVMTDGGPLQSTMSVVLMMYKTGFKWWSMGYSAAVAFALFAIIAGATLIQMKLQKQTAD